MNHILHHACNVVVVDGIDNVAVAVLLDVPARVMQEGHAKGGRPFRQQQKAARWDGAHELGQVAQIRHARGVVIVDGDAVQTT